MTPPSPTPEIITSRANPRIRAAARLRERRERDRIGRTLVDGAREIGRAAAAGARIETVFVSLELALSGEAAEALAQLGRAGIRPLEVSRAALGKLAFGDRSDGLVAVVEVPPLELDRLALGSEPLVLVLEGLEKPGNVGAILRTADAAGVDAVIAASPRTDLFNPNAIRASLGTIFSVPLASGSSAEVRAWLAGRGIRVLATRAGAAATHTETDLRGPLALVLGAEADGLDDAWSGDGIEAIGIPMAGMADSLNVAAAAAVLAYEARRQRRTT
jgi:TrmH family RNA methyltransferase